mmetsp:Transcript_22329/g.68740  ORF Transcript_22329/g.68740 Transcript_22329/m.68740 type:complete len:293 (+) Transcript_22329:54-932(+)
MVVVSAHGVRARITVLDEAGQPKPEYVDRSGTPWIAAEAGKTFQVKADFERLLKPGTVDGNRQRQVMLALYLDGKLCEYIVLKPIRDETTGELETRTDWTFQGYWLDSTGDRRWAYTFGAPHEDAKSHDAEPLKMTLVLGRAKRAARYDTVQTYDRPDTDSNRVRKFFQPNVEYGDVFEAKKDEQQKEDDARCKGRSKYYYDTYDYKEVTIRYATEDGLRIRGILPALPPLRRLDDNAPRGVKRARESDAVKAPPDDDATVKLDDDATAKLELENERPDDLDLLLPEIPEET